MDISITSTAYNALPLAPRDTTTTGTAIDVVPGEDIEVEIFVTDWQDGTHTFPLQIFDGADWSDVESGQVSGNLPTVTGLVSVPQLFAYTYSVGQGISKVRAKHAVVDGTDGCTSLFRLNHRQMFAIIVLDE